MVDDGSTDDSGLVVERAAAGRPSVRLVRHEVNRGVNEAVATGIAHARGDWLAVCAVDDVLAPNFVERMLAVARRWPQAGICFSEPAFWHDGEDRPRVYPLHLAEEPSFFPPDLMVRTLEVNFFTIVSTAAIYRRDALVEAGGFLPALRWHADLFANYVLAFRHGAAYLPEPVAFYRPSSGSYSATGRRDGAAQGEIVEGMLELLARPGYADVAPAFRRSAFLPDFSFGLLPRLLRGRMGRRYLTARLIRRLLFRSAWRVVMPFVPDLPRRALRRVSGALSRSRAGRAGRAGMG